MFFEGANFNIYEVPVFIFDILMIIFYIVGLKEMIK